MRFRSSLIAELCCIKACFAELPQGISLGAFEVCEHFAEHCFDTPADGVYLRSSGFLFLG